MSTSISQQNASFKKRITRAFLGTSKRIAGKNNTSQQKWLKSLTYRGFYLIVVSSPYGRIVSAFKCMQAKNIKVEPKVIWAEEFFQAHWKLFRECKACGNFQTKLDLPKFESLGINYSQAVYKALQGQDALGQYLEWIKNSYGFKYGETQAYDLGKYIKQQHVLRVRKMMVLFKRITFRFQVNFLGVYLKSEFI